MEELEVTGSRPPLAAKKTLQSQLFPRVAFSVFNHHHHARADDNDGTPKCPPLIFSAIAACSATEQYVALWIPVLMVLTRSPAVT